MTTTSPEPIPLEELRDTSTFPSSGKFDQTETEIRGARVVLEWVARSWLTQRRRLFWALRRGYDIARLENADKSDVDVERVKERLVYEAVKVEYVRRCVVRITPPSSGAETILIEGQITLIDGKTYPLIVRVAGLGDALTKFGAK